MRKLVNPKLLMSSSKILTTMRKMMMTMKMDPFSSRDLKEDNNKWLTLAPKKKTRKKKLMKTMKSLSKLSSENMKIRSTIKKTEISISTIYDLIFISLAANIANKIS